MKKIILIVAVATMIAGVVFVACQKEITKTDKKEVIKQGVKQQKMENFPMEEFPNLLYSHDGVNFFDENGAEITGIRVDFGEANRRADIGINENGHEYIIAFEEEGDNCGVAIIWYDELGMSWEALYAICPDGRIIIEANPEEPINEVPNVLYSYDGVNFFDENGAEITGIRVDFGEANRRADIGINENGHEYIIAFEEEGDNCGVAIIWYDEVGMSWEALYAICPDGRIIIASNINPNADPIDLPSTFFISENGPYGHFHDEFGNSVEMEPIYEEPVGIGRLFSDGRGGYRVECEINPNGTTCGTVWVDINGVDQKGVYWCTPDREKYIIDLSWHLN